LEGIFTLPYSEYDVINKISKLLKKSEGYGFYIPVSRQQKGVDFVIVNHNNGKTCRVQVKGSRAYYLPEYKKKLSQQYSYGLWFNNFIDRYEKNNADIYVLYGLYPELKSGQKITTKNKAWKSIVLCFSEKEMLELLNKVKTKKELKKDKFFGMAFNTPETIFTERGFLEKQDISYHLIQNYVNKIEEIMK
jgi:hypothetical protein